MTFSASYDRAAKIISILVCLALLGAMLAIHHIVFTCVSLFVVFLVYACSPRGYLLAGRSLSVQRLAGSARIALDEVRGIRRATAGPVRRSSPLGTIIAIGVALAALGLAAAAIVYSPGPAGYTLTPETLTIHDRFYPVTLRASEVDVRGIRIVDLRQNTAWRPIRRTGGFANSHYQAGWFQVAGGQKVRLYRANSQIVVLLPPKGNGAPVLYQAADPEKFAREIRAEWSSAARRPAQRGANAGKWIYYAL
jgi:hypothetical protein